MTAIIEDVTYADPTENDDTFARILNQVRAASTTASDTVS
jgi:hypothetical protein